MVLLTQINMADLVQKHDFVEVEYTGRLPDGIVFDTTNEDVAKKNNLHSEKMKYGSATICVGEKQLLPGLDNELVGKELAKQYTITLAPEQAFGKRDIKKMKIVPMSTFIEHKLNPRPGLQINVDGEIGTVTQVSGGRVIVNFNHPLAGKEVIYDVLVKRKVIDNMEKIKAFLNTSLRIPEDKIKVTISEEKAMVEIPAQMPAQIAELLGKKLAEVTQLKMVEIANKEEK